jgi:hypothetical protein
LRSAIGLCFAHVARSVMREIGFMHELARLGFKPTQCARRRSELATWRWLRNESALGEMLGFDFEA